MLKIHLRITEINYILVYISRKPLFYIVIIFHYINILSVFFYQINGGLIRRNFFKKKCDFFQAFDWYCIKP